MTLSLRWVPDAWPRPPAEPLWGIGVYVMRTLRDFFHMGRVEWVTVQEPWSQVRVGGVMGGVVVGGEEDEVEGWRSVISGVLIVATG